jgi:hypothetical protein
MGHPVEETAVDEDDAAEHGIRIIGSGELG